MSSTKINEALRANKDLNIVEFARDIGNREYNESGVKVGLPEGMERVDLDTRPVGGMGAIFKNLDYSSEESINNYSPGRSFYKNINDYNSINDFREERKDLLIEVVHRPEDYNPPKVRSASVYDKIYKLSCLFTGISLLKNQ